MSINNPNENDLIASVFEERAENLSQFELNKYTVPFPHDAELLFKLKGPGPKLLVGPRGSGKSTLLRKAFFELLESKEAFPVYVNFSKSLALEPYFFTRADALKLFRQWVLAKIILGFDDTMIALEAKPSAEFSSLTKKAKLLVSELESGSETLSVTAFMTPTQLTALIEDSVKALDFRRTVLLLDDAAHAFSAPQQAEFFEIFTGIRSRYVSAKAAVYPGVTHYSGTFNIGHDAELLQAWLNVDTKGYLEAFRSLFAQRIPREMAAKLTKKEELIDYLAYAAYGIPRHFLNAVSALIDDGGTGAKMAGAKDATDAVASVASYIEAQYNQLGLKLPRYKNFIKMGNDLKVGLLSTLRLFNLRRDLNAKAVGVALAEPIEKELGSILDFMKYSGLLRSIGSVKQGSRGSFQRYGLHYALLIANDSLGLGQSNAPVNVVRSLEKWNAHHIPYTRASAILGENFANECTLNLAPCSSCGAPRASDEARYCINCGAELIQLSVYKELLMADIEQLPITEAKKHDIKSYTQLRSVQDVLLDIDGSKLRTVPYIGPKWAQRIRNAAEEYVSF